MENLQQRAEVLRVRCASVSKENTELQAGIREEEEDAQTALAGFSAYRNKMEAHRAAVLRAASQTEAHKVLEEKRAFVRRLTQKKEELREDLENPNGNAVRRAEVEEKKGLGEPELHSNLKLCSCLFWFLVDCSAERDQRSEGGGLSDEGDDS